jgi:hypothetical protein
VGDDHEIATLVRNFAETKGVQFRSRLNKPPWKHFLISVMAIRLHFFVLGILKFSLLKLFRFDSMKRGTTPFSLFYTQFPSLWDLMTPRWSARLYGSWPDYLEQHGRRPAYAANYKGTLKDLFVHGRSWRSAFDRRGIFMIDAFPSWMEFFHAHMPLLFYFGYWNWRRHHRPQPLRFRGWDIQRLWWRELDRNIWNVELPFDLLLAAGLRRLLKRQATVRTLFHGFEFQPMDKALAAACFSLPIRLVGLQSGMISSNLMGISFLKDESRFAPQDFQKAPIPDYLCAYGELAYRLFKERLSPERVCLVGPIRFGYFSRPIKPEPDTLVRKYQLPSTLKVVLLTTSIAREESVALLQAGLRLLEEYPDLFLLIKFHYYLPLADVLSRQAPQSLQNRYRLVDEPVQDLFPLCRWMLCAGSSTALEALWAKRMPLIYRPMGEMPCNPMIDVPDSAFFWHSLPELRKAIASCEQKDAEYRNRQSRWDHAIAAHIGPTDGSSNERLHRFLEDRGLF